MRTTAIFSLKIVVLSDKFEKPKRMKFQPISTERLELSELKMEYAPQIFALRSDGENGKYLHRPLAKKLSDAEQHIEKVLGSAPADEVFFWVILIKNFEKNECDFAGLICLWNLDWKARRAEIGYELLPDFHGKRIVQEAMPAVLQFGFEKIGLLEIFADLDSNNLKSLKILEKNGFRQTSAEPPFVTYTLSLASFLKHQNLR